MVIALLRSTRPISQDEDLEQKFKAAVGNTGNYFFEEALQRQLPGVEIVTSLGKLPAKIDILVLSMSNFLSPSTDLGSWVETLSRKSVDQVVMVGAGAQAWTYDDEVELSEGTKAFAHWVASHSVTVGVRGFFTAEVLRRIGIRNVEVIGCPSAFWTEEHLRPVSTDAIAVHCTPNGHYRDAVAALFRFGMDHNATFVIQSEKWMLEIREGANGLPPQTAAYYARGVMDVADLSKWIRQQGAIYFGMTPWIDAMEQHGFVIGSRFHGNMAAIQAGTPALNLPFDTRTRELVEYLNLPHMPFETFRSDMPVDELAGRADFDFYRRTLPLKRNAYIAFMRRNGLGDLLALPPIEAKPETQERVRMRSARQLIEDAAMVGCIAPEAEITARLRSERSLVERKKVESGAYLG